METKIAWQSTDQKADQKSVDKYVGGRLRLRRKLLGKTQSDLGRAVGLTFQQIQKYENGVSRIGAGRLWQIGQVLTVPVSFFFDGLDGIKPTTDPLVNEREIRLCHDLRKLSGPRQKCLFDLVNTFAGSDIGGDAGGGKP